MNTLRYAIYEITALSILTSSMKDTLKLRVTENTEEYLINKTYQEDCAMFYQAMKALNKHISDVGICEELLDQLVFIDFAGIFDGSSHNRKKYLQDKSEKMFMPSGIQFDFGMGYETFVAFERSASMSRASKLCFIRKDLADKLYMRIQLNMSIGECQLSKLYAYNGLMFTSGRRIYNVNIFDEKKTIIIDNPKTVVPNVPVITVEDDGTNNPVRRYSRIEKTDNIEIEEFDGEGIVSPSLAKKMDNTEEHLHHSFQIRMPYIKGVVHEVDFKSLYAELDVTEIEDIYGVKHPVSEVEMILTKSMFKGFGWMKENSLSWKEYLERCREYDHALYVSGMDQVETDSLTELNYQFLNTIAISEEEFRPKSLPFAWNHSPSEETTNWLTKATETEYYNLACDSEKRREYFLKDLNRSGLGVVDRRRKRAKLLQKNSKYITETVFTKELKNRAERLLMRYSIGKLLVAGDNRYLSDDLMRLLAVIAKPTSKETYNVLLSECLNGNTIYAPKSQYEEQEQYTLLRNPHIARNEEASVKPLRNVGKYREKYLSHLHYVVMVDSRSLNPDRLGGADYDGDMVKTVADPLLSRCIKQDLPVLKIPTAIPLIQDANDWRDRFFVVKSTFSSRVGQISNAALRRSIIAYNENTDDESRDRLQEETEILAILTGLEIDSAKSGIKPDLSEYLGTAKTNNTFLQYKNIVTAPEYLKSDLKTRLKQYFASVEWGTITSNIELLPLYGKLLGEQSKTTQIKPVSDEELFTFAADLNWKEKLDKDTLKSVESIIADYEEAQKRLRYYRHDKIVMRRQKDIRRILFMQNKDEQYTVDELYHAFDEIEPYRIKEMRQRLETSTWLFTKPEDREVVAYSIFGTVMPFYLDVFCDFSHNGYRILFDVLADLDDMYGKKAFHDNKAVKKGDSRQMKKMLAGLTTAQDYMETLISNCIQILAPSDARAKRIDFIEAVKCAVALGKRQFAMEVLPAVMLELTVPEQTETQKKGWWRRK